MKKVISYRQKLIELARIYKIDEVFDQNIKFTTYDIEIILLKNKVPIPSRRGYLSHKLINEVLDPLYELLKKNLSINISLNNYRKRIYNYFNKKISNSINNFFNYVIFNITNFFKILSKTIVTSLNNIYNFQVKESLVNKVVSRVGYVSLVVVLVYSVFYIKEFLTDVDSVKISLEIKSDKKEDIKYSKKKEIAKIPDIIKKDESKNLVKKLEGKKKLEVKKKPEVKKKFYDPENDFNLNTQTVLNLFEDLEYNLNYVRNKKIVKPIYFTRLPKDLDSIKSVKEKKEIFLQILLPLIVAENEKIEKDRKYLLKILKENLSEKNKNWLNKKYKQYRVSKKNINELIEKIDIIPTSIALAQAAKESGWGTSRFALEGNAIFGQWTWNGVGIEPLEKDEGTNHKILKFPLLRASVKAYITNLNTHSGYKSFRKKRAELRVQNKKLSGLALIHELDNYAQTGKEYTKILEQIIKQNDLDEFETVTIDDYKENNQLKL